MAGTDLIFASVHELVTFVSTRMKLSLLTVNKQSAMINKQQAMNEKRQQSNKKKGQTEGKNSGVQ